jgi:hypothetical protein
MLVTKNVNDKGIYRVLLHKEGMKREITVDDYIPCFPL